MLMQQAVGARQTGSGDIQERDATSTILVWRRGKKKADELCHLLVSPNDTKNTPCHLLSADGRLIASHLSTMSLARLFAAWTLLSMSKDNMMM